MEKASNVIADVLTETNPGDEMPAAPEPFSFVWLETFISQHTQDDDEPATPQLGCAFAAVVFTGVLAAAASLMLRNQLGLRILQAGIALQWLCVAAVAVDTGRRAWRFYRRQHAELAQHLDEQMLRYDAIVGAICRYPPSVISASLRYVRDRRSRFVYRAGLICGGFDKLGIFPLLAAMYLQVKDWPFGDWKTLLDHAHLVGNLLLWMLIITYVLSWWAVRAKGRLDLYEMLLEEASLRLAPMA